MRAHAAGDFGQKVNARQQIWRIFGAHAPKKAGESLSALPAPVRHGGSCVSSLRAKISRQRGEGTGFAVCGKTRRHCHSEHSWPKSRPPITCMT